MKERQVSLTQREWILVRVALLRRLTDLQKRMHEKPMNEVWLALLQRSYDDTKALLNGKLSIWKED